LVPWYPGSGTKVRYQVWYLDTSTQVPALSKFLAGNFNH